MKISIVTTHSVQNVVVNLTWEDREFAEAHLVESHARLHAQVDGLSPAQWTFRAGEAWSPLLILEHVYIVEAGAIKRIVEAPPSPESRVDRDGRVMKWVTDRSHKMTAPEAVTPQGRTTDPAALLAKFDRARLRSLEWLRDPAAQPRLHAMQHPFLGMLDGYQWLLFLAQHLDRHLGQLEELKAHPDFP